jgi:hypothetical protein
MNLSVVRMQDRAPSIAPAFAVYQGRTVAPPDIPTLCFQQDFEWDSVVGGKYCTRSLFSEVGGCQPFYMRCAADGYKVEVSIPSLETSSGKVVVYVDPSAGPRIWKDGLEIPPEVHTICRATGLNKIGCHADFLLRFRV